MVCLPTGTLAEQTLGPPSARACFPTGNDGGEGSRRPTKRWHTFPRAWRRGRSRALPGVSPRASLALLAHLVFSPSSPASLSRISSPASPARLPTGMTAAKGLVALPNGGTPSTGANGGEGSRRPTKRWRGFPRASWPPSVRACFPRATTAAKGLAALPNGGTPSLGQRRRPGSGRPTKRWHTFHGHDGADRAAPSLAFSHGSL